MTLAHWRDIAILILVIEALLGSVLPILALAILLASLVRRANSALRDVLHSGQAYAASLAAQTDGVSRERLVKPVVSLHAANAGARAFLRSLIKNVPIAGP